jgi:hypothetical protein
MLTTAVAPFPEHRVSAAVVTASASVAEPSAAWFECDVIWRSSGSLTQCPTRTAPAAGNGGGGAAAAAARACL